MLLNIYYICIGAIFIKIKCIITTTMCICSI
nr:MAG TPA: hypothetical protein [Caudoviricetes sp.]